MLREEQPNEAGRDADERHLDAVRRYVGKREAAMLLEHTHEPVVPFHCDECDPASFQAARAR